MTGRKRGRLRNVLVGLALSVAVLVWARPSLPQGGDDETNFRFVILGDRTGEAFPGAYEEAWRETDADNPDFVITVGDTIQGGDDNRAEAEWHSIRRILAPYRKYPMFFVPGNHDVWSSASARIYETQTGRPLHYSFNYKQAHFTILDNSRTDALSGDEIAYLKRDLQSNPTPRLKFVFCHRPSWLLQALLKNPNFPLHQLALQYGVRYVISGHLHEMLRFELGPVTYISMPSSGGHLREPKTYEAGWFFQHTLVTVRGNSVEFAIKELKPPLGQGRISGLKDWGTKNLLSLKPETRVPAMAR